MEDKPSLGGEDKSEDNAHPRGGEKKRDERWELYSGLFVLLKQKIQLGREVIRQLIAEVLGFFQRLVYADVRSHV